MLMHPPHASHVCSWGRTCSSRSSASSAWCGCRQGWVAGNHMQGAAGGSGLTLPQQPASQCASGSCSLWHIIGHLHAAAPCRRTLCTAFARRRSTSCRRWQRTLGQTGPAITLCPRYHQLLLRVLLAAMAGIGARGSSGSQQQLCNSLSLFPSGSGPGAGRQRQLPAPHDGAQRDWGAGRVCQQGCRAQQHAAGSGGLLQGGWQVGGMDRGLCSKARLVPAVRRCVSDRWGGRLPASCRPPAAACPHAAPGLDWCRIACPTCASTRPKSCSSWPC